MQIAIVLPTFNERENIPHVVARLNTALTGLAWEAIFVDDDSPDGTAQAIAVQAQQDPKIRLVHRVGRRGLSSACIEGMLSTDADFIAVMDADLQHDETILPQMLARLQQDPLDVVVGTRNAKGGSMGCFRPHRVLLSQLGRAVSHVVCSCELSDPMSGFFVVRKSYFLEVVEGLDGKGFKLLVDMLSAAKRPVRCGEVGYTFGMRRYGNSKLDTLVGLEYLHTIVNRGLSRLLPMQHTVSLLAALFCFAAHLSVFFMTTRITHASFMKAQVLATTCGVAGTIVFTHFAVLRQQRFGRLEGTSVLLFACVLGAVINLVFAHSLWRDGVQWYLAGPAGALLGATANLLVSRPLLLASQVLSFVGSERSSKHLVDLPDGHR